MNDRETRRYEMFVRVSNFGSDHAADFAAGGEGAKHFANLNQVIAGLDTAKAGQKTNGATAKEVLLDALRLDLQNIARTARAIAQDQPGFADRFKLPANPGQIALLTAADAILAELNKPGVAAKFIAHEMPADFVQSFTNDRHAVDSAQSGLETSRESGVASTATIGPLIANGMKEITYLNAIMHNKYGSNPDKLAAWHSASHIERDPQRAKKTPATPVPAPGA